jgi:hypothetical protein
MPSAPASIAIADVVGSLDVGRQDNSNSVYRLERALAVWHRDVDAAAARRELRILIQVGRRVDDNFPALAVEDHRRTRRQMTTDVVQADDRRHAKRSRENRGVIRTAACVCREAANASPIELRDD